MVYDQMAVIMEKQQEQGVNPELQEFSGRHIRKSMKLNYDGAWRRWVVWCKT